MKLHPKLSYHLGKFAFRAIEMLLYPKLSYYKASKLALQKNIEIRITAHYLDFISGKRIVRISMRHFVYSVDIIDSYDYYFSAVKPIKFGEFALVDYSLPKYHEVIGFDLMPVFFPSLSEPMVTTHQYLDFAGLKPGGNVLDLGAYAGVTSILFKESVGELGTVIAVDADEKNIVAIQKNFDLYRKLTGKDIDLIYGAAWNHSDGLTFSSEGNMGSSATAIVGPNRGDVISVKSFTLSKIVEVSGLKSVDFLKCDIEGAESVIFEDAHFFEKFKPKVVVESHMVGGQESAEKFTKDLEGYGYKCERVNQIGVGLPLYFCTPP
ncbi:Methyltransf_21 domain-containing protein [Gammaproteobacteria bacterium]